MLKFFKESLIAQILFIFVIGAIIYFVGPWIFERISDIFGLYTNGIIPTVTP